MNLPLAIAWRYLKRPTDALVSAVGLVSVLGLVIGVMALVISMALMTGYRNDLQTKLLAGNAEVFVYSIGGPMSVHRRRQPRPVRCPVGDGIVVARRQFDRDR